MVDKWGTAFALRRNRRLTVRYSEALLTRFRAPLFRTAVSDFVPIAADQSHMCLTCVWKGALIDKVIAERIVFTSPSFLCGVEF